MIFRQLFDKNSSTYTYLLGSRRGNALIIDSVAENIEVYITLLKQLDLKLVYSLDTHIHADHISGAGYLRDILGCETIYGDKSEVECGTIVISDNELLTLDEINLRALFTPGHTDDSFCFLLESNQPNILFSGDTLLIRGTGRTDFQNGDPGKLYESIKNKLLTLKENTKVFPGHDYNGFNESTIGEEINFNPRLNLKSKEEFINFMKNLNLEDPKMMDIAVPLNKNCGRK